MNSDEQLILEFQKGHQEAFVELFERYRQPLYGFFRRRLNDAARAEELAQECFLAVIRGAERYEPRATFRTYLYAIALKQLWAERRRSSRGSQETESVGGPPAETDPDTSLWVRRAIEQVDAQQREVLMLREYEELSYEEISQLLRIPLNTVKSRLFRARMALKDALLAERNNSRTAVD
jgi:RNA polymerase sigma-70 factor, ECF subfamily